MSVMTSTQPGSHPSPGRASRCWRRPTRCWRCLPVEVKEAEDIFRLSALGLDWDIGVRVYEPQPAARITRGADGKKVGIFLLHGGAGDFKSMEKFALLFAEKFAFKVVTMTFPGRLYLDDASRDWPGDTIHADGTVRTPIWQRANTSRPISTSW